MTNEEKKKQNLARLWNHTLFGLTAGIWEFVGESSFAMTGKVGENILQMMEKEMGLEILGENPIDVLNEIARLFIDEYGLAGNIEVIEEDGFIKIKVKNCINTVLTDKLAAAGIEKAFICPVMLTASAALKRLNVKVRQDIERWVEGKGSIISFELM